MDIVGFVKPAPFPILGWFVDDIAKPVKLLAGRV